MRQYLTTNPEYIQKGAPRFKVIDLTPGTGEWVVCLVDTFREESTPTVFPGIGTITYRILQQYYKPRFEKEQELKAFADELNAMYQFQYYLANC